jgi:hypothetical protein
LTIPQAHAEVNYGWADAYSPQAIAKAVALLEHQPVGYRINILVSRLLFRGIYFPLMGPWAWVKAITNNRRTIFKLVVEALGAWRKARNNSPEKITASR